MSTKSSNKSGSKSESRSKPKTKAEIQRDQKAAIIQAQQAIPITKQTTTIDKPQAQRGRPTDYSDKLIAEFCSRIAMGDSMRTVCAADDMPACRTIFYWLGQKDEKGEPAHPDFLQQYARACQERTDAMAEDVLDIADNGVNDYMEVMDAEGQETGGWRYNGEAVQRSRLRVETRLKLMAVTNPKKYGNQPDTVVAVNVAPKIYLPKEMPYNAVNIQEGEVIDGQEAPQTQG